MFVGALVHARYARQQKYYAGRVEIANADGTFAVRYDDGDFEASVLPGDIKPHASAEYDVAARPLTLTPTGMPDSPVMPTVVIPPTSPAPVGSAQHRAELAKTLVAGTEVRACVARVWRVCSTCCAK
jgi:hypothetical protein